MKIPKKKLTDCLKILKTAIYRYNADILKNIE